LITEVPIDGVTACDRDGHRLQLLFPKHVNDQLGSGRGLSEQIDSRPGLGWHHPFATGEWDALVELSDSSIGQQGGWNPPELAQGQAVHKFAQCLS
jgi:hypothetical protein